VAPNELFVGFARRIYIRYGFAQPPRSTQKSLRFWLATIYVMGFGRGVTGASMTKVKIYRTWEKCCKLSNLI
jgi:hypothetical protein